MKTLFFLLQKEFLQIFRNRLMLPVIFVLPVVQLLILVHAANLEMKDIDLLVVDMDLSATSRQLAGKFEASPFFRTGGSVLSVAHAEVQMRKGLTDMIMVIPGGFEVSLVRGEKPVIQLLIDAINGTAAGLAQAYATAILAGFRSEITNTMAYKPGGAVAPYIEVTETFWYNPRLNYKIFMIPGIMVLLVTIIGMFLSALNLVREKEMGTMEQINVTPIKKYQFILGKLIPFWIIALFELSTQKSLFPPLISHISFLKSHWLLLMANICSCLHN